MIDSLRETIVFAYDTPEQRSELFALLGDMPMRKDGLRVVAMSVDNEVTRVGLLQEAIERYDDKYELLEALDAVQQCEDLKAFSWERFEAEE